MTHIFIYWDQSVCDIIISNSDFNNVILRIQSMLYYSNSIKLLNASFYLIIYTEDPFPVSRDKPWHEGEQRFQNYQSESLTVKVKMSCSKPDINGSSEVRKMLHKKIQKKGDRDIWFDNVWAFILQEEQLCVMTVHGTSLKWSY